MTAKQYRRIAIDKVTALALTGPVADVAERWPRLRLLRLGLGWLRRQRRPGASTQALHGDEASRRDGTPSNGSLVSSRKRRAIRGYRAAPASGDINDKSHGCRRETYRRTRGRLGIQFSAAGGRTMGSRWSLRGTWWCGMIVYRQNCRWAQRRVRLHAMGWEVVVGARRSG